MEQIAEFLPFLIPLVCVQFGLLGYTLYHILTHQNYKRGNRTVWLVLGQVSLYSTKSRYKDSGTAIGGACFLL